MEHFLNSLFTILVKEITNNHVFLRSFTHIKNLLFFVITQLHWSNHKLSLLACQTLEYDPQNKQVKDKDSKDSKILWAILLDSKEPFWWHCSFALVETG